MPFVAVIGAVLVKILQFMAVRFMASLGVGILAYTGYSFVMDKIQAWVEQGYNSLPSQAVQLLNIAGFDFGIGIIFAAYNFKFALKIMNKLVFGQGITE